MAGPIRQPIDLNALQRYIERTVPEIKTPLEVKQFGFGQSNPTYELTSPDGSRCVLRKKPPGKLLSKTAHQVEREYKIIHALENTDVPVPKTYCLCEDDSIIGTPFYIMEFLDGRMVTEPHFPGLSPEERTEMWRSAVLTLAKLHRVNPSSVNLTTFGKPKDFYTRQVKTLSQISHLQSQAIDVETHQPVGPIPHFDDMATFFTNKPSQPQDRATLMHGDYKIDNLVFHKTEPRVIGILDWELATIGHPLADLVNLTGPYSWMHALGTNEFHAFLPDATPGLPPIAQLLSWYRSEARWDPTPDDMSWANAFGGLRAAVIMQGIAARFAMRQASGVTAKKYADQFRPYGQQTWKNVEKLKKDGLAGGKEAEEQQQQQQQQEKKANPEHNEIENNGSKQTSKL